MSPAERDYLVFDATLAGFGIRVLPSGKKSFIVQYRKGRRTRRITLGQYGPMTPEMARREANRLLGLVRSGAGDPAAERDEERAALSMNEFAARFMREHVELHCKPNTRREYHRSFALFILPLHGEDKVRAMTLSDVAALHGSLAHIPYQANRTLGVLSKMMNFAESRGIRPRGSNPCDDVKRYPERKRERFLSDAEVKRLGAVLDQSEREDSGLGPAVAAFRLLLLTGCRLSEIQTLEWRFVDLDRNEIRLPDSKTGAKTVYFGPSVAAVLSAIPRLPGNPYVITGRKPAAHLTDLQNPWRRLRREAGIEDVRIHDLRHTFASKGLIAGEGLSMIGKLLGHTQVQTTARYAHLDADPVKSAAGRISDQIAASLLRGKFHRSAGALAIDEAASAGKARSGEPDNDAGYLRLVM